MFKKSITFIQDNYNLVFTNDFIIYNKSKFKINFIINEKFN